MQNRTKTFVSIAGIIILLAIIFFVIAGNNTSENSMDRVDAQLLDYIEKQFVSRHQHQIEPPFVLQR